MAKAKPTGYLPGDPRYGLTGESLKDYYRNKPAEWAIYCWDKPGMAGDPAWAASGAEELRQEFRRTRDRLRPFPVRRRPRHARHLVLHAARRPRGGGHICRQRAVEQGRRLPARRNSPLVEQLPEARGRLPPQGPAAVSLHGAEDRHAGVLPPASARPRIRTSPRTATASFSAGRSARPTARTTSAPRCCWNCRTGLRRTSSGTTSRSPGTAATGATRASSAGCSGIDAIAEGRP